MKLRNSILQFVNDHSGAFSGGAGVMPPSTYQWQIHTTRELILAWAADPDLAVFCDNNVFAGPNLVLVEVIVRRLRTILIHEVYDELRAFRPRTAADAAVEYLTKRCSFKLFDDDTILPAFPALNYYLSLLGTRRKTLSDLIEAEEQRLQRPLLPEERKKISGPFARGMRGTSRIATKEVDASRRRESDRMTDEILVIKAFFHAAFTGESVLLFSDDDDVFSQFFKLTSLITCDYLANLIATDYAVRPEHYPHRYEMRDHPDLDLYIADKSRSFALGLQADCFDLVPRSDAAPQVSVIKPGEQPQIFSVPCPTGMKEFLLLKSRTRGRNIETFDGLNCYSQLLPANLTGLFTLPWQQGGFAFFLDDILLTGDDDPVRISEADRWRSIFAVENPATVLP